MTDYPARGAPVVNIPSPDPSDQTVRAIREGLASLREVMDAEMNTVVTRLDGIDRATVIFNDNLTRVPTDTDKQISHLKELHAERFDSIGGQVRNLADGIAKQFAERDVRTEQAAAATKIAVDAALQAQKEAAGSTNESNAAAIAKSEAATAKQIDGILALLQSNVRATDDKITDIKGRLDRGEGVQAGGTGERSERRLDAGASLGLIVATIMGASLLISVAGFMAFHH